MLGYADRQGDSGLFVTYLMERIDEALAELLSMPDPVRLAPDRMALFLAQAPDRPFRRKDYMNAFPRLSTASASRELAEAVEARRVVRVGDGRAAIYRPSTAQMAALRQSRGRTMVKLTAMMAVCKADISAYTMP